ncbi:MAG TPA: multicopper oxidase domain-containing protein, partial [Methylocella sp.]|nr:multicopper oxidase domain-containing protein [Methylocella sp.]
WKLNGKAFAGFGPAPLFSVKRGTPVTLGFVNHTVFVQEMRVHGHAMRLLHDLDDGWEPYWRDAVLVPEGKTKHAAFVADNPGKWAIACSIAGRQATGMATWFEVT